MSVNDNYMKTLFTLKVLFFSFFTFAQTSNANINKIRKIVEQINKDTDKYDRFDYPRGEREREVSFLVAPEGNVNQILFLLFFFS